MARTSRATSPAPAEPEALPVVPPKVDPELNPAPAVEAFLIGPPSAPMTPGWLMGIGSRPETPAEHATRLGAKTGAFSDAGYLLGTLAPRPAWPAPPVVAVPTEVEPKLHD